MPVAAGASNGGGGKSAAAAAHAQAQEKEIVRNFEGVVTRIWGADQISVLEQGENAIERRIQLSSVRGPRFVLSHPSHRFISLRVGSAKRIVLLFH